MVASIRRFRASLLSLHGGFVVSAVALSVFLLLLNATWTFEERQRALDAARIGTQNLARSLAQHAHDTIQAVDAVLVDLRERVEVDGMAAEQVDRLHQMMAARVTALPLLHGLFVFNANGLRIATSVASTGGAVNSADRGYFQYHARNPSRALYLGSPVRGKFDGAWVITISRRIDGPNGGFAGVAVVTVSVDYLQEIYNAMNVGDEGAIALDTESGIMIARHPSDSAMIGNDVSGGPIFRDYLQYGPIGSFQYLRSIDGIERLGSYRRIDDYPLVIIVARGLNEALVEWRIKALNHLVANLAVASGLILTSVLFARQVTRRQRSDYLYRLLADNSSDAILCIGLDGKIHYISPTLVKMIGWPVEAHLNHPWQDFLHPEDVDDVVASWATLEQGAPQATASFRYICKDGSHLWVEARVRLMTTDKERGPSYVAAIRDISERKAADRIVTALNQELVTQANTDALTGLANRRCFDTALDHEWRRASREANVLSLVMIDVDRFKLYNDRYGHQQGDYCLRTVSQTIAQLTRRTGDIVARFGGEEIVVLLPGVHEAGATEMAEAMRAAVEAVGLEHADNPPSGVVTASFGVAALLPRLMDETRGPAHLLATADAALYEAKRSGRNRVVTPGQWSAPTTPGRGPAAGHPAGQHQNITRSV